MGEGPRNAGVRAGIQVEACHLGGSPTKIRHSGESQNLFDVKGIPAFAGMTELEAFALSRASRSDGEAGVSAS